MEALITQREAAERITEAWGIPMHETKLSMYVNAGVGPEQHSKRGTSTMYAVVSVDNWAAAELMKKRDELLGELAVIDRTLAGHGYTVNL